MTQMTNYEKDLTNYFSFNGKQMSRAKYNLAVCIRDVKLFNAGMRINRHWRLKYVKHYFGLKGGAKKILSQLQELQNTVN